MLDPGYWIQDPGSRNQDPGSWIEDPGSWIQDPGDGYAGAPPDDQNSECIFAPIVFFHSMFPRLSSHFTVSIARFVALRKVNCMAVFCRKQHLPTYALDMTRRAYFIL